MGKTFCAIKEGAPTFVFVTDTPTVYKRHFQLWPVGEDGTINEVLNTKIRHFSQSGIMTVFRGGKDVGDETCVCQHPRSSCVVAMSGLAKGTAPVRRPRFLRHALGCLPPKNHHGRAGRMWASKLQG